MSLKFQHTKLVNKKNVYLMNGEINVEQIGAEGHFTVKTEAEAKVIKDNYKGIIFAEGEEGYTTPTVKSHSATGESKVYQAELELRIEKLEAELEAAKTDAASPKKGLTAKELKAVAVKLGGKGEGTAEEILAEIRGFIA